MPKVIIEFNLPDEQHEYDEVMKASNYSHCLWSFDQEFLRANTKHGIGTDVVNAIMEELKYYNDPEDTQECKYDRKTIEIIAEATLDHVRSVLYEYMNSNNANPFN